ncbi:MAG: glycosyltransferase [Geminicoccaceae bacterium]|nr:glycosyltransferase [Geminicoccaceae bacterium]MCB9943445.1 glycosyltransferase [Geminicoccaceae bacterium]
MYLALYILLLAAVLLHAPPELLDPHAREFVFIIGIVGIWRYSWGFVHFLRALIYKNISFPRWRRYADRLLCASDEGEVDPAELYPEAFIVITAFRIRTETVVAVLRAALLEARDYPRPVTIVASVVEMADERLAKQFFREMQPPSHVRLAIVRVAGSGKRDGLSTALRAIGRMRPPLDSAVMVMDGDAVLPPGTLRRSLPFLRIMPDVAGFTTDEDAVVDGSLVIRAWHRLRFAQRQVLMCSMGLSRKLLTMTGRMSVFRSQVATDPDFIAQIRDDAIDHWRLGRIKLLTGEDKSTWFWLLKNRMKMLYIPDVRIITIEHPPGKSFFTASTRLMKRWFGNMLRASGRAIDLGPRQVGLFTWWCLIDQRVSMWTPLIGPLTAICFAILISPLFLYVFVAWILITRFAQTLMLLAFRDTVSGLYPFLIYYNQVYGAFIKTYVLFRLDRQTWTRQQISSPVTGRSRLEGALQAIGSAYVHALALLALFAAIGFLTGLLTLPSSFFTFKP